MYLNESIIYIIDKLRIYGSIMLHVRGVIVLSNLHENLMNLTDDNFTSTSCRDACQGDVIRPNCNKAQTHIKITEEWIHVRLRTSNI